MMTHTLEQFSAEPSQGELAPTGGSAAREAASVGVYINERDLSKLRWRCRRGLLENDLFIEHFFDKYASNLTVKQAQGLTALMSLSDNDLLDLNLARKSLEDLIPENQELDCPEAREVLAMLRSKVVDGVATLI